MIGQRSLCAMLRYKADRRTVFFVASYFASLALAWRMLPEVGTLGAVALTGLLCVLAFMGAVATHNAIHTPLFHAPVLNRLFQVALTLTYGHPVSAYVPGHNLSHHRYAQSTKDVMRTTKVRFRYNLLNLLFFMPTVVPSILRADSRFVREMYKRKPAWFGQYVLEGAAFIGASATLLVLDWRKFLVLWFVPHTYAAWGIVTMNFLQHDGTDDTSPYNHSRNFIGRAVNWWTYNNGYHGLHHMDPALHWSLLPEEHAKRLAPFIDPRLERRSLLAYAWTAFVFPGRRVRFDGAPLALPPEMPDESWIPRADEPIPQSSLGAVA